MLLKTCISFLLAILYCTQAYSQSISNFLFDDQKLVLKATDSVLYVVRQDYVLRNNTTGVEYGRGGKDHFGRIYGLAVLSDNKLWCDSKMKSPWLYDNNFSQYRNSQNIQPVLTKTAIRRVAEKEFSEVELIEYSESQYDSLLNNLMISTLTLKEQMPFSIKQNYVTKDNNGWIIIVYTKELMMENENCELQYLIYRPKPQFESDMLESVVKPPSITSNILGGIYFNAEYSVGSIDFIFSGILHKKPMNWFISAIPNQPNSYDGLTPVYNEDSYVKIKFVYEDGFVLKHLCDIKLENREDLYCTDNNGIVEIPVAVDEDVLILLNGKNALYGRKGETYTVKCEYYDDKFYPENPVIRRDD